MIEPTVRESMRHRRRLHPALVAWLVAVLLLPGCASGAVGGGGASDGINGRLSGYRAPTPLPASAGAGIGEDRRDLGLAEAFYEYYDDWEGVPYRLGGIDRDGIDCSAFVRNAMLELEEIELPRTTHDQVTRGDEIPAERLAPGDLVFFKTGRRARHVGIYVGKGRFMHASSSRGVTVSRMDNVYWRDRYWQSRRLSAHAGTN